MLFRIGRAHVSRGQRGQVLVQIFLNTTAPGAGFQPRHVLSLAYTYHELAVGVTPLNGAADAFDKPVLDRVFLLFNGIHTDRHSRDYFAAGNRSLSPGDVVAIDGRCYACTDTAWQALHAPLHTRVLTAEGRPPSRLRS
ncbi:MULTISPECIES: hypothetical protein [Nocardia]|uniref:Uncharacterized protein n=1 Tax=Nocardia africana TaxID=134964 RepID=A0A378X542_9NOCA|nr:hypothetical protein [Nocardia africana]MCC3317955.1 hypothetical protein [Nocardia africana]SUA48730.1 Uncharacterised protein [Nocardia africana]